MAPLPFQILVILLAGWLSRHQQEVIEYPQEENRILRGQLGGKRLCFSDAQRRRLARKAKPIGRRKLREISTIVPGTVFTAFFVLNLFVWSQGSTAAVPFSAIMAVMAIWFCISLPQVFLGAVLGYKKAAIEPPVREPRKVLVAYAPDGQSSKWKRVKSRNAALRKLSVEMFFAA